MGAAPGALGAGTAVAPGRVASPAQFSSGLLTAAVPRVGNTRTRRNPRSLSPDSDTYGLSAFGRTSTVHASAAGDAAVARPNHSRLAPAKRASTAGGTMNTASPRGIASRPSSRLV
ncbi:hypothetical protein DIE16_27845 [Burkholderia sp. Bp9090]|nr:hypothetical protein DIE16_27845 [Burkholderia sp. Bp9090]